MAATQRTRRERLTNVERQAQTRKRLLAAAAAVFARRGFHGASVEEVASEAGYTTGALYHQFKGKSDLFQALLDEHVAERVREYTETFAGGETLDAQARGGANRWMAFLREEPDFFPLFIEFWAESIRDPELRARFAAHLATFHETFAGHIEQGARDVGIELPEGFARQFGIVVNALGNGIALARLADPDAVPDELLGDALSAIFQGLSLLAARAPEGEGPP